MHDARTTGHFDKQRGSHVARENLEQCDESFLKRVNQRCAHGEEIIVTYSVYGCNGGDVWR